MVAWRPTNVPGVIMVDNGKSEEENLGVLNVSMNGLLADCLSDFPVLNGGRYLSFLCWDLIATK